MVFFYGAAHNFMDEIFWVTILSYECSFDLVHLILDVVRWMFRALLVRVAMTPAFMLVGWLDL